MWRAGKISILGLLAAFAFARISTNAQPVPKINSISREWVQRGTTLEATLTGENLGPTVRFIVSGESGVSAELAAPPKSAIHVESSGGVISAVAAKDEKRLKVKLNVAADAPLGDREVRAVSPTGVSNPVRIRIGYLPEVTEQPPNTSLEQPQKIELPLALSGKIGAATESDYFRFQARKGEQLIFEIDAARSGSPLDSSLALLNRSGTELTRNEDAFGLDSLLEFKIPEDGEYILQVRDFRYRGGNDYGYRLMAGAMPYVRSAFPFGAQRGQDANLEIRGSNLEGISKLTLHVDASAPLGRQDIRVKTPSGISNLFPFDVGDAPEILEKEPNNTTEQAQEISVPATVNGRIEAERDTDVFKFTAKKNQQLVFEIAANRFGSPLDALLTLRDAAGKVIKRNDDATGIDARIEHKFNDDGSHIITVEDLLKRHGPEFSYRLSIRQPEPDFLVRFLPDNPRVSRGAHVPIRCELTRLNGFNGAVRAAFSNLPAGLHSEPLLFGASNPGSGFLVIAASEQAPLGTLPIRISAITESRGTVIIKNAEPLSNDKPAKESFLTVLDAPPFAIELLTRTIAVDQDQSGSIEAIARRRSDFKGEIKISAEGFTAGREPISKNIDVKVVTLKENETRAAVGLKAKLNSEIGTREIVVKAEATVEGQTISQYSAPIPMTVHEVPFALSANLKRLAVTALPSSSQSAAREALLNVKAERRMGFAGEIELKLEGLPEGISATVEKIPAGSGEVPLKVVASEKAPVGKELTLTISGSGLFNDRIYRQRLAEIKLTVSAPAETLEPKTADVK